MAPYRPPPTARIPADALPDPAAARRTLAARLAAASAGSRERVDLEWLHALDVRHGDDPQPGRRATIARALRVNAWWYATRGAPSQRVILRDPDGIILTYRDGHGFAVNPVATTGRWRGLNEELPPETLADALLELGVVRALGARRALVWEYFDIVDRPEAIRPGVSGMAQARMAELLSAAWLRTRDVRYAEAVDDALTALEVPVADGGVVSHPAWPPGAEPGPWYVERAYPGEDPWKGAALNGFMVSLLSLRSSAYRLEAPPQETPPPPDPTPVPGTPPAADAAGATVSRPPVSMGAAPPATESGPPPQALRAAARARRLADAGARTLHRFLPVHDTGTWSLYGMVTPGRPPRTYLADLNYHCYHVYLLRSLGRAYPDLRFTATADRWQGYVDRREATCPAR